MTEDDRCPNCGALWEEDGFNDVNEFGEASITCANCGYSEPL